MTTGAKARAEMKGSHALRCIECGTEFERAGAEFRCPRCGDLLEVVYPGWAANEAHTAVWASQLKQTWWERNLSRSTDDASGVWRFR
jgi:phage FluMu protein Com